MQLPSSARVEFFLTAIIRPSFHHVQAPPLCSPECICMCRSAMVALLSARLEWLVFLCPPSPAFHIYSDAAGFVGCGAFAPSVGWFQLQWPQHWLSIDIAVKELVPVVISAALWGRRWEGHHVRFHSDNITVIFIVNKCTARDPLLKHFLHCLFFYAAYYKFHFSAAYIAGTSNAAADTLSPNNLTAFSLLVPQVSQTEVPSVIQDLLVLEMPDWISP